MIDIRKLKELVRLMVANDLTELDLRDSEEQVTLRRPSLRDEPAVNSTPAAAAAHHGNAAPPPPAATGSGTPPAPAAEPAGDLHTIASPMVGTFYSRPNPDDEPFVAVGARITEDTVVCLIEAMKIFNEIKADTGGTVEQVLVESGASVEFGQPLFTVRPG